MALDDLDAAFERMTTPGGDVQGPMPLVVPKSPGGDILPDSTAATPSVPEEGQTKKYDDVLSMLRDQQKSIVQGSMFAAERSEPDRRAKAIELSKKIHMPAAFVEKHYDELSKRAQPDFDYDQLLEKSPGLSKWLENPDNAAIGRDDLSNLSNVEEGVRRLLPKEPDGLPLGQAVSQGWHGLMATTQMLGVAYGLTSPDEAAEAVSASNRKVKQLQARVPDYVAEYNAATAKEGKDTDAAAKQFWKTLGDVRRNVPLSALRLFNDGAITVGEWLDQVAAGTIARPRGWFYSVAQNLPNMLPSAILGAAGFVGGAYTGGAAGSAGGLPGFLAGVGVGGFGGYLAGSFAGSVPTEIGSWMNEELGKQNVDTSDPAALAAAFRDPKLMARLRSEGERKGLATASVDLLFNALGGKILGKALGPGAATGVRGVVQKATAGAADTAVQMVGETVGEGAGAVAATKGDLKRLDFGEWVQEGITSLGHSVGDTIVGASIRQALPKDTSQAAEQLTVDTARAIKAGQTAEQLQQLADTVRESKTLQRLPEKVRELVEFTTDGEAANVYFQTDDWDSYWTKQGLSPVKAAEQLLGDGGRSYMDAKEAGTPLAVPMADYVTKLATDEAHFEGLLPVTRTDQDGMTFQQAREHMKALPATMEDLAKEAAGDTAPTVDASQPTVPTVDPLAEIRRTTEEQLVAAGRPAKEAKFTAEVRALTLQSLAELEGVTPDQLAQRYGLTIAGPEGNVSGTPNSSTLNQAFELPSIDIEDEFFTAPEGKGERALPALRPSETKLLGIEGEPAVVIKENIAKKNLKHAKTIAGRDREIIQNALYQTTEIIEQKTKNTEESKRWVMVGPFSDQTDQNAQSVVDVIESKGRIEVVNWYPLNERDLRRLERRARKEGGTILITDRANPEGAARLSALQPGPSGSVTQSGEGDQGPATLNQSGDQTPLGQITLGSDLANSVIRLFKGANASTGVHELAHHYLAILEDLGSREGATEAVKARLAEARKLLGNEGEKFTEAQQEKFARSFEQYLQDGKAPTPRLKQLFRDFRTWLTNIYRSARGLGIEISPEMRAFFDRMLVSEEEIRAAQESQGMTPLFGENPEAFGLTGKKAEAYKRATENARKSAEEALTAKVMKEYEERRSAEYEAERDRVRFEVEAQVDAMPVYRAWVAAKAEKLSTEAVREAYGFKAIPENIRKLQLTAEDGVQPDIIAEAFGFPSGKNMLDAIAQAAPRDTYVDQLTDQRMRAERPELIANPQAMRAAALEEVHNDNRAEMLRLELEHLASQEMSVLKDVVRKVTRRMPPEKAVRDQANRIIGEQKVGEIRPDAYERAERKSAKQAGEALAKGDLEAAFEAKRRELLNHELYRAAIAARETIRDAATEFRKLARKDEDIAKSRDMDLVNTARAVLAAFGFSRPPEKAPEAYLAAIKAYDEDTYVSMQALYESATQSVSNWREARFEDFVAMKDAVSAMWALARETKTMEIDGRKVAIDQVTGELKARIAEMTPEAKAKYTQTASDDDRRWTSWLGIKASLRRVESWVTSMDGAEKGIFRSYIWNPISEAAGQYREYKKKYLEQYLELVKGIEKTLTHEPILAEEFGHQFRNKGELLGALLHVGNASNKYKLLVGWKWTTLDSAGGVVLKSDGNVDTTQWDAFVRRAEAEGLITKADWDFVQGVWDLYEQMKPDAQRVHKKLYGFYFNEITAEPVMTSHGEYRGGYAPAIADPDLVEDASLRQQKEALEKSNNSFMFPTAGRGFTKNRNDSYAAKLAIDLRYIPMQIDKVSRFVHLEPAVKQVSRIVMNKSFRESLASLDKAVAGDMLVPWLQRSAQQKVVHPSQSVGGRWLDKALRSVRARAGMQIMFLNVTNAMQQLTGFSIAAVKVKPKHLRNALWEYSRSPSKSAEEVSAKSLFMRNKLTSVTSDMLSGIDEILLNPSGQEKALEFAKKHAYVLQSAFQNVVDNVTWMGAYEQSVEQGQSEVEAVRSADSAVRATQGSLAAEDVSRFETGTPLQRAFTMFYSYFNTIANLQGAEFSMARELGVKKGAGRMLYVTALSLTIPAVLSELIVRAMSGKGVDEDDDDQYLEDVLTIFFGSQARQATAMVPIAGQIANAGFNRFNNKWYDDRISTSPAISLIESAVGSPASIYKAMAGTGSKKVAVRDALTAIGLYSGFPVLPAAKPIGYLLDYSEGKAKPTGPIDFTRGLITGRPGGKTK